MANQQVGFFRRITGTVGRWLGGSAVKAGPPTLQSGWGRSWGILGTGSDGAYSNTPSDWMSAAQYFVWVANCVAARANAVSSVPLKLYKRSTDPAQTDAEEQTDHPVIDLLRRVNELLLDEASFKREGERSLCVHGEWVTSVSTDSAGKPTELYILQPAALTINRDPFTNYPESYNYGGRVTFAPDQLIRIYYPRLDDPVMAQSPTATAIAAVNRYEQADRAAETIDKAGGMTRGILGTDFAQMDTDSERFVAEWNSKKINPARQHEDMFLPQGMTRESGVLSAQEQEREARMERLKKEVFAAFSVPPAMAGDYSDASVLANADQQERNFWMVFGVSELGLISEGLNTQLLWRYWPETRDEGLYLAFDTSTVPALQENRLETAQLEALWAEVAGSRYSAMISTLNESREYLGLDKINDPRADAIAFPEQLPGPAKLDENGQPVTEAEPLGTDNIAQLRQISRDYQTGKYTRSQAEKLMKLSAPSMSPEDLTALLVPEDKAPADIVPDLTIPETRPVVDVMDAYNQDMISEPQARVILKLALPEADEAMLTQMLVRPASRVAQLASTPAVETAPAETPETEAPDAGADTEEDAPEEVPVEELSPEDVALDDDTAALLEEALAVGAAKAFKPRDPDSIKRGPDGKFAPDPNAASNKPKGGAVNYNDAPKRGKGKKGKKPKMTEEEKAAKRAEAKAKRDAERAVKLQADVDALREALVGLQGKDDPSNLRKRISQQIDRVQAKLDALKTGRESSTQKLLNEAATKAEASTGAMIALMLPALAAQQVLDQVSLTDDPQTGVVMEPAEELHITLAYLGKAALLPEPAQAQIMKVVTDVARETAVPLSFTVKGSGRFTNPGGDALWAGVGVDGLQELRECLVCRLREAGVNVPDDHGDYQPHVTLAYLPTETAVALPSIQSVRVDLNTLTLMLGGERYDFPIGPQPMMPAMPEAPEMDDEGEDEDEEPEDGEDDGEQMQGPQIEQDAEPESEAEDDKGDDEEDDEDEGEMSGGVQAFKFVSAKAKPEPMPIVDFVGMHAIDAATGTSLGVIEKISRFGEHGALTATKAEPVVYVNGTVYRAADVRVVPGVEE